MVVVCNSSILTFELTVHGRILRGFDTLKLALVPLSTTVGLNLHAFAEKKYEIRQTHSASLFFELEFLVNLLVTCS